jgi:hypothetical protein
VSHHASRGVSLPFSASHLLLRAYWLGSSTLGLVSLDMGPRRIRRRCPTTGWWSVGHAHGLRVLLRRPDFEPAGLSIQSGSIESQAPLVGSFPLRRLRSERSHHVRVPPWTSVPLMPILTASATCSAFRSFRYLSGNVLGVWVAFRAFPSYGAAGRHRWPYPHGVSGRARASQCDGADLSSSGR